VEHFHPNPSIQAVIDQARADRNAALHAVAGSGLRAAAMAGRRTLGGIRAAFERALLPFSHRPSVR
jgi:hypothetical protein